MSNLPADEKPMELTLRGTGGYDITFRVDHENDLEISGETSDGGYYKYLKTTDGVKLLDLLTRWLKA